MTVIDAQVHLWGAETPEQPWPPDGAALAHRPTLLEKDELPQGMDAAGVDRAIIVPPSWEGDRNDLAMEAALLHQDRFAVMGRLAIEQMVFTPGLLPQIAAVAVRHSGLCLILGHLAQSGDLKDAALGPALKPTLALVQYPNVAVKATSLPSYVTKAYPYPSLHAHIRRVVEAYGSHRIFWRTDLTRGRGSYRQAVTLFTEELDFLSDIEKTWIMGRGHAK
jgi:L-fuconolactonase